MSGVTDDSFSAKWRKLQKSVVDGIRIEHPIAREMLAECLGTFILMVFGNGSVAQSVLSKEANGSFISINWAFGLGVTMGVYVAGKVSGAHLNPAVSLAFAVFGKLPWYKLCFYILAQVTGAFISGAAVYSIYYEALNAFDGGSRIVTGINGTGGIFATYPQDYLTIEAGLWDQVFATALLVGIIFAITDEKNNDITTGLTPLLIGLLVFVLGLSYGLNCGYAINPARDFGPRLFTFCAGWGVEVFTTPGLAQYWFWVPIVGPCIGGILGASVYKLMIGIHLQKPNRNSPMESEQEEKRSFVSEECNTNVKDPALTKL